MNASSFSVGKPFIPSFFAVVQKFKNFFPLFVICFLMPLTDSSYFPGGDPSKWFLLYFFTGISLISISSNALLFFPNLTVVQKYLLYFLLSVLLFNYFYHKVNFFEKESTDRILFWLAFLYYCSILKGFKLDEKGYFFILLFVGAGSFVIGAFSFFEYYYTSTKQHPLAFTFYNINKAAEFIGFSLSLLLALYSRYRSQVQRFFMILTCLLLTYLYFAKCRSSWLGIGCVVLYLLWTRNLSFRTFFHILFGTALVILITEYVFMKMGITEFSSFLSFGSFYGDHSSLQKESSLSERWDMILNSLYLIRDYPWGVGLGRFELGARPYMQNLSPIAFNEHYSEIFSPHNEILRMCAEEGILASLVMFLFFVSFVFPFRKLKEISKKCPESIAFLIFFGFQFLFQYPLMQPFPLLLVPFVLAYTAHYVGILEPTSLYGVWWVGRVLGVIFVFIAMCMAISLYITTHHFNDLEMNKKAYSLWKNKNLLGNILFMSYSSKQYKVAIRYATQELKKEPCHALAQKYLGLSLLMDGDRKNGCDYLKKYDSLFRNHSSVHKKIEKYCD